MIFILNITLILVTEGAQVAIVARIEELLQEAAAAIREKTGTEPLGGGLGSEAARRCEFLPGRTASSAQSGGRSDSERHRHRRQNAWSFLAANLGQPRSWAGVNEGEHRRRHVGGVVIYGRGGSRQMKKGRIAVESAVSLFFFRYQKK